MLCGVTAARRLVSLLICFCREVMSDDLAVPASAFVGVVVFAMASMCGVRKRTNDSNDLSFMSG